MTREGPKDMKVLAAVQSDLGDLLEGIQGAARFEWVRRVAALVEARVAQERARCAGICRERAGVWQRTPAGKSGAPPAAREEARARANEALYIADLLESGAPPARPAGA